MLLRVRSRGVAFRIRRSGGFGGHVCPALGSSANGLTLVRWPVRSPWRLLMGSQQFLPNVIAQR